MTDALAGGAPRDAELVRAGFKPLYDRVNWLWRQ
jgi:hypothetical protein